MDWIVMALSVDGTTFHPGPRTDYEVTVMYAFTAAAPVEMAPMDGTHVTTSVLCLSPHLPRHRHSRLGQGDRQRHH